MQNMLEFGNLPNGETTNQRCQDAAEKKRLKKKVYSKFQQIPTHVLLAAFGDGASSKPGWLPGRPSDSQTQSLRAKEIFIFLIMALTLAPPSTVASSDARFTVQIEHRGSGRPHCIEYSRARPDSRIPPYQTPPSLLT